MPDPSDDSRNRIRLNQYELIREVGRGRTGTVYEANDRGLRRIVAVKVLSPDLAANSDRVWRFVARAATAARVVHHNVASIFFIGQEDGSTFCAGEFATGGTLATNRERIRRAGIDEALRVASQLLEGLRAAHALGVIHGNLHDGNVLFDDSRRRVVLTDFEGEEAGSRDPSIPGAGVIQDLRDVRELLQGLVPSRESPPSVSESPEITRKLDGFRQFIQKLGASGTSDGFQSADDALATIVRLQPDTAGGDQLDQKAPEAVESAVFLEDEPFRGTSSANASFVSLSALPLLPESVTALDRWTREHRPEANSSGPAPSSDELREESTLIERAVSDVHDRLNWLDQFDSREKRSSPERISSIGSLRDSLDEALRRLIARQEAMHRKSARRAKDRFPVVKLLAVVGLVGWMLWLLPSALDVPTRLEIDSMLTRFSLPTIFFPTGGYPNLDEAKAENENPNLPWVPESLTRPPLRQLRVSTDSWIKGLEFCPDRSLVAVSSSEGGVQFALAETGQHVRDFVEMQDTGISHIRAIAFSPDGRHLAIGNDGRNRSLLVLDVASGRVSRQMRERFREALSVGFSADGRFLGAVLEGGNSTETEKSLVLFNPETGEIAERFPESDRVMERLLFSPTAPFVAVFGEDRPITLWNYSERKTETLKIPNAKVAGVAFSPDGAQLAAATRDGRVVIWDLKNLSKPRELIPPDERAWLMDLKFSPDGKYIALMGGGLARIWDWSQNSIARYFVTMHGLVSFSSDGRFITTAGNGDSPALVWDVSDLTSSPVASTLSPRADHEAACRRCRHLASIRQTDSAAFRKSLEAASKGFPVVEVQGDVTAAAWQELRLNKAGLGFDGIRFRSPLSEPADLHWAFNVSAAFVRSGITCLGSAPLKTEEYRVESNLLVPELRLPRHNGVYFQEVIGGGIMPGKECVIWFRLNTTDPVTLSCALHARPTVPMIGVKATSTEIATAMGWKTPFARSARPYSQKDRFQTTVLDIFDFEPRLPFSADHFPAAPLDDYIEPPGVNTPRRTILRRPQP